MSKTASFYRRAKQELDEQEITGGAANPRIVQYLKSTTLPPAFNTTDETPWCSGFANFIVKKTGVKGTDSAAAVSWLNWGVKAEQPGKGTIVVFQWPNGGHHVGFVSGFPSPGKVSVLGGNQSNKVKISDFNTADVIGYRNPDFNFFSRFVKYILVGVTIFGAYTGLIAFLTRRK